ncbi:hypothetical protein ACJX0J_040362, partial [Zea mays]
LIFYVFIHYGLLDINFPLALCSRCLDEDNFAFLCLGTLNLHMMPGFFDGYASLQSPRMIALYSTMHSHEAIGAEGGDETLFLGMSGGVYMQSVGIEGACYIIRELATECGDIGDA